MKDNKKKNRIIDLIRSSGIFVQLSNDAGSKGLFSYKEILKQEADNFDLKHNK